MYKEIFFSLIDLSSDYYFTLIKIKSFKGKKLK